MKYTTINALCEGIAESIRVKEGSTDKINPQDFPSRIENLQVGGGGTPTPPTPDMPVIGDGKTYLYIKIAAEGRMTVPLYFSQTVANGVTIDWGDGSETETLSGTGNVNTSHAYAEIGEYTISLNPTNECTLGLGHNTLGYCVMGSTNNNSAVYCNMLQAVEIGRGVTTIDDCAFSDCSLLSSVVIPDSITKIGNSAFAYCGSLTSVVIPDGVTSISDGLFKSCSLSSIVIPESVTTIYSDAFSYCSSLSSIVIPKSVTVISPRAFSYCTSLSSIVIPDGVTSISDESFNACSSLSSIVIPDGVTIIYKNAFKNCYSLSSIVIPDGITYIGSKAFNNCYGVAFYDFSQCTTVPTLAGTDVFNNIASDCKIVVPDALYDTWITTTYWSTYASKIVKASEFNS